MQRIKSNSDIILIIILGIILRFKDLSKFDLWYDEAYTGLLMRLKPAEFYSMLAKDSHPPLFSLITKAWTFIFGVNDFTLRFLPFVFGVATIYVVYRVALTLANEGLRSDDRSLLFSRSTAQACLSSQKGVKSSASENKETAAISAFLAAINPFLIDYSIEARSYSFYGLVTALTFLALLKRKTSLFALGIVVMTFTHYISFTFIATFLILYLFMNFKKIKKDLSVMIPLFIFLVLQVFFLLHKDTEFLNIYWVRSSNFLNIFRSMISYFIGIKSKLAGADELVDINFIFNQMVWGSILVFAFLLGTLYLVLKKGAHLKNLITVLLPVILPQIILITYGILFHKSLYVERYLFPSAIFFVIACGYVLSKTVKLEVVFFILVFYVFILTKVQTPKYFTGMELLASSLKNYQGEIVFVSPIDFTTGEYYFGEQNLNLRLLNPKDPAATYGRWPYLNKDLMPKNLDSAIFISPANNTMTGDFNEIEPKYAFGNYHLYELRSQN